MIPAEGPKPYAVLPEDGYDLGCLPLRIRKKFAVGPGCWEWLASTSGGYGRLWYEGVTARAHRIIYELLVGPIAQGLTIDHLCRNRGCVNPAHLEPVSHGENMRRSNNPPAINARKTHCTRGHEFTLSNTYINPSRERICKQCKAIWSHRWYMKKMGRIAVELDRELVERFCDEWKDSQDSHGFLTTRDQSALALLPAIRDALKDED